MGLTCAYPQGAYGVVRLAYNESEDRHYVSLGIGGRCCPSWVLESWGWGMGRSWEDGGQADSKGSELLVLRGCKDSEFLDPGNMQAAAGCL